MYYSCMKMHYAYSIYPDSVLPNTLHYVLLHHIFPIHNFCLTVTFVHLYNCHFCLTCRIIFCLLNMHVIVRVTALSC